MFTNPQTVLDEIDIKHFHPYNNCIHHDWHFTPDRSNFILRNRHSIRLNNYDYTGAGGYFITLATYGGAPLFGEISVDQMVLNPFGEIVRDEWLRTAEVRPGIILDEFIIMPNHLHGIIFFTESVGAHGIASTINDVSSVGAHSAPPTHRNSSSVGAHSSAPLRNPNKSLFRPPKSLGSFIAGFKSIVTKRINILRSTPGTPGWQRNYYEHIIRNDDDLYRIRDYIRNNVLQWITDPEYQIP